jgi:hypothetical protein
MKYQMLTLNLGGTESREANRKHGLDALVEGSPYCTKFKTAYSQDAQAFVATESKKYLDILVLRSSFVTLQLVIDDFLSFAMCSCLEK